MFYDNALEKLRSNSRIPYSFGINHNDRTAGTHAETWRLAALHTVRTEKQFLSLKQLGEK